MKLLKLIHYVGLLTLRHINSIGIDLNKREDQSGVKQVRTVHEELDYKTYGFNESDLDKEYYVDTQILTVKP